MNQQNWHSVFFPFLKWWPRVTRSTFRDDLMAGVTGAVVALPQGVAFATIAGMPPEYGLYAGMIPAIIAALFGSSWHLVSGPTTAASIVIFSVLSQHAEPGSAQYVELALTLTLMVGLIQFSMGLARFGTLVNFISHSVVVGFTAGAAILIATSQLKHFLGLSLPRGSNFHETIFAVVAHGRDINMYVTAVGLVTMIAGLLIRRFKPQFPYMIVSMLVGSVFAFALSRIVGAGVTRIVSVGALPSSLPPLSVPEFSLANIKMLAPAALATTLFALTEALSIARSLADKTGQNLDANQEFIGQGMSNIFGCFFSGYVATGSFNRSGLNYQAGAKTPLAAIFAGSLLIVIVVLVAPLAAYLPNAAMAGILFLVAWRLIDFHHIRKILRASRYETLIMGTTFFATLFLELEFAIFLGVMLSLALYLKRTSHPRLRIRVPDPRQERRSFVTDPSLPECPQLKIIRIEDSLYFGAVNYVRETLNDMLLANPGQKHLLIVAREINFIDMAGAEFLVRLAEERKKEGGGLYFYHINEGVCDHFSLVDDLMKIGAENIYETKREAIAEIFKCLDKEICAHCTARIFLECRASAPYAEEKVV
ncbi:MAG: SulP family inorganic anion transporter [Proteobacteria bacterium]|nr:SulP family inorganic anion transporter [Pseudomonadota bacterium]MBU1641656.1 SulP family inorganic anion transporter [Pseudomonadota bacterium]